MASDSTTPAPVSPTPSAPPTASADPAPSLGRSVLFGILALALGLGTSWLTQRLLSGWGIDDPVRARIWAEYDRILPDADRPIPSPEFTAAFRFKANPGPDADDAVKALYRRLGHLFQFREEAAYCWNPPRPLDLANPPPLSKAAVRLRRGVEALVKEDPSETALCARVQTMWPDLRARAEALRHRDPTRPTGDEATLRGLYDGGLCELAMTYALVALPDHAPALARGLARDPRPGALVCLWRLMERLPPTDRLAVFPATFTAVAEATGGALEERELHIESLARAMTLPPRHPEAANYLRAYREALVARTADTTLGVRLTALGLWARLAEPSAWPPLLAALNGTAPHTTEAEARMVVRGMTGRRDGDPQALFPALTGVISRWPNLRRTVCDNVAASASAPLDDESWGPYIELALPLLQRCLSGASVGEHIALAAWARRLGEKAQAELRKAGISPDADRPPPADPKAGKATKVVGSSPPGSTMMNEAGFHPPPAGMGVPLNTDPTATSPSATGPGSDPTGEPEEDPRARPPDPLDPARLPVGPDGAIFPPRNFVLLGEIDLPPTAPAPGDALLPTVYYGDFASADISPPQFVRLRREAEILNRARSCYAKWVKAKGFTDPTRVPSGTVTISYRLDADGRPFGLPDVAPADAPAPLRDCVKEAVSEWKLPPATDGGPKVPPPTRGVIPVGTSMPQGEVEPPPRFIRQEFIFSATRGTPR